VVRKLARAYATESPAAILMGGGSNHWYHGDLQGRALALCAALTGNIGRSGGGFSVYVGQYKVRSTRRRGGAPTAGRRRSSQHLLPARPDRDDAPDVPYPKAGYKGLFCTFANMFVQSPDLNRLHETLDGLDLIVVVDHQMTDTAKYADVVLPAATWYEKYDLTATPLHPFLQLQQPAVEPVGESRSELWMWREIVKRIDPALAARYFEHDELDAIRMILAAGDEPGGPTEGITLEDLRRAGAAQCADPRRSLPRPGPQPRPVSPTIAAGQARGDQEVRADGRIEFYKWRTGSGVGETVPTYTAPHDAGVQDANKYRSSSSRRTEVADPLDYANNPWLLEIHAASRRPHAPRRRHARGIHDGDAVEVSNDRGRLVAWAEVTEAVSPGSATLFEGWWPRFFKEGRGVNDLTASSVNPIHEVHYVPNMWCPSTGWKDCVCEVRRPESRRGDRTGRAPCAKVSPVDALRRRPAATARSATARQAALGMAVDLERCVAAGRARSSASRERRAARDVVEPHPHPRRDLDSPPSASTATSRWSGSRSPASTATTRRARRSARRGRPTSTRRSSSW